LSAKAYSELSTVQTYMTVHANYGRIAYSALSNPKS
jgi:hypothetical protein